MIACILNHPPTAVAIVQSGLQTAELLNKKFTIFIREAEVKRFCAFETNILKSIEYNSTTRILQLTEKEDIETICEELEISMLFIQLSDSSGKNIFKSLQTCRNLRIPYLLFKDNFVPIEYKKVILPVCFLEEEVEKAPFAAAFARFCQSDIYLLKANDYGSKTTRNEQRIVEILGKFDIQPTHIQGKKDSFKINFEAVKYAAEMQMSLLIVTASREYGLDDLIFGPPEQKIIKQSNIPVLLLNPRSDLYALCD